ncbi:bifunctional TVP38/TMEM64 family protein/FAD-dependent oxidoreductase [Accumulibacter sp.]|uniref:FAD-dependent oxidoreductase n=1 Tax=Accumulibacter sp. TaxID=2053492 RepID=UPI0025E3A47F|nr:bifunctional TVP38/TMEM64 family protein/FAD-dependent oxidoreductase [Accumulibacter sp.]MCM8613001.1 FAD-dependent oxidoreductase [Accumulibacter sp.]MCM8637049.1 FAD-dependent oxidoreductase [Accumulibacter sp.]MCM8640701.1 FAD-dependent oxidoreductase [Accumulibacter sp.]
MNSKKIVILALIVVAVVAYFQLGLGQYLDLDALKTQQAALGDHYRQHPWQVAGFYFTAYIAITALSLPGAALLTLAGGAIFGLLWGTVIVSFASSIGATLAFLAARFLLRDWVGARFGERLKAVDEGIRRDGAFYLFTLRLIPVFPFFLVNLLLGLTAMKARTFYWVSQAGMLAGTVVYVNAGTQLARIDSLAGIVSPGLLASFALLGLFPLLARKIVDTVQARQVYAGWRKPKRFDRNLVVIGAGSAGLVTAYIAAAVKARVTLVEKHRMGGDCLNTGCVPSKALIRSAKLLSHIARAREFGIAEAEARFDFAEVMERVQRIIRTVEPHDSVERYRQLGVDVVAGAARIVSPWQVEISRDDGTTQTLSTRSIVIATGARPFVPPLPRIEEVGYLTSDTVWDLRQLPRRLLVLGGGPIGCELTQAFARLGAQVTQVERGPRIMPREDPEVSAMVAGRFRAEGVRLLLEHQAKEFVIEQGEKILIAEHAGGEVRIPFDGLLVALGRVGNLSGYGLEELGITGERTVAINEFLQTRYPNIHAAGDVAGPFQFTHTAAHQAWYAAVNSLFAPFRRFRADYSVIPWSTFVEPEVARVGLNEQEAKARGIAHEVSRYDLDDLDRAIADGEAHGFIKVLTVPGKDRILGVTIVGEHAGDLIAEYVLAMKHGIGLNRILGTIHIYPTLAEANKYVAGVWKKAHAPAALLRWVERFHTWRRSGG